jgi:hypothetical protein
MKECPCQKEMGGSSSSSPLCKMENMRPSQLPPCRERPPCDTKDRRQFDLIRGVGCGVAATGSAGLDAGAFNGGERPASRRIAGP